VAIDAAIADAAPVVDAAVVVPVDAAAPDAAVAVAPSAAPAAGSSDSSDRPPPRGDKAATKRQGALEIHAMPVLTITVDGKPYGDTPKTIKLTVGRHKVILKNTANDTTELVPNVMINENQTTTIDRINK